MACRVWNLDQGRELVRVRKEAVGKQGTTFLTPHIGLGLGYRGLPDRLVTKDAPWKPPGN